MEGRGRGRGARAAATLALAAACLCGAAHESTPVEASSEMLAKSLRRALMKDNYDYMSDERAPPPPRAARARKHADDDRSINGDVVFDEVSKEDEYFQGDSYWKKPDFASKNISKINGNVEEISDRSSASYPRTESANENVNRISHKVNMPPVFKRNKEVVDHRDHVKGGPLKRPDARRAADASAGRAAPAVKYKILKVGQAYRRSGNPNTLIQEEAPNEVSIVNLGGGPVPQFGLAGGRRQYMHGPRALGALGGDDELPPPPAHDAEYGSSGHSDGDSDKTTRAQDFIGAAHDPPLALTATPDDILVL